MDPRLQPPGRELRRAIAAGAAGTWSWSDAALVFGERVAEYVRVLPEVAYEARKSGNWPEFPGAVDGPFRWAIAIVGYRPGEIVPTELPDKLQRTAQDLRGWYTYGALNEVADAAALILALETPDARRLREKAWAPRPPVRRLTREEIRAGDPTGQMYREYLREEAATWDVPVAEFTSSAWTAPGMITATT